LEKKRTGSSFVGIEGSLRRVRRVRRVRIARRMGIVKSFLVLWSS
jgi:hypothetical protein